MQAQGPSLDPITVVLIAAAATAVLGRNVKVKRIRLIQKHNTTWEQQGRFMIHTSHLIGKNN